MKLTRKRAIEVATEHVGMTNYCYAATLGAAETALDYGIVLGLQMALAEMGLYDERTYPYIPRTLRLMIARRLQKLEGKR